MLSKLKSTLTWLPAYFANSKQQKDIKHIYFSICDHFEPYWRNATKQEAIKRIYRWIDTYPQIADNFKDSTGNILKYSFFYPIDEYQHDAMEVLSRLCRSGYGEVEVHLHHDNDTSEHLRNTLLDYKNQIFNHHGLLSTDRLTGNICYGFIHGNWALANSRPDGRWCGVNDEISILEDTGCFADFTLPSAPDITQTSKINSIYLAATIPERPKSHNSGFDVEVGKNRPGLLMVQGPLCLSWHNKKFAFLPRIENGSLHAGNPSTPQRIHDWVNTHISVCGASEHVFVKVHTHGAQEDTMKMFFDDDGLAHLLQYFIEYAEEVGLQLHFVSARQMTNVIRALESGCVGDQTKMKEYRYRSNI